MGTQFVISGNVRWCFVGPQAIHDTFEAEKGSWYIPQGHFHYFENTSDSEELVVLIIFNTSVSEPADDIGIVAALSAIPPEALAAVFKTPPETFRNLPRKIDRVTLVSRWASESAPPNR
jgi:oxalate decarboxylase